MRISPVITPGEPIISVSWYKGDLAALCDTLRAKGVTFPVALKHGVVAWVGGYVAAPDGVSIELMQC